MTCAPADDEQEREADLGEEADERVVERRDPRRDHLLGEHAARGALEVRVAAVLLREGLHDAHAADVLLRVGGQLGDALLDLLQRRPRAPAVAGGDPDDEGDRDQRDDREQRVDDDHRDRREGDRQRRLQDPDEAVAEEEPHGLQVDGRPRHELTGLLAVEEPELQRLQVVVERLAQQQLDAERDAPRDEPPGDAEDPARDACSGDRQAERAQLAAVRALDRVDGHAGERRDGNGPHGRRPGQHQRPGDAAPKGPQEPEQPPERSHPRSLGRPQETQERAGPSRPRGGAPARVGASRRRR